LIFIKRLSCATHWTRLSLPSLDKHYVAPADSKNPQKRFGG
jgi:hypothetical protein